MPCCRENIRKIPQSVFLWCGQGEKVPEKEKADGFYEHDFLTGLEKQIGLDEFPTYDELIERFKSESNEGSGIAEEEYKLIEQPYYSSQTTYPPRYYQRIAVNRTVDAIAKGQDLLYFSEGYSQEEIAKMKGVSQNTISKKIRRITKKLTEMCRNEA